MTRILEILAETTKASGFRNACLAIGSAQIANHVKDAGMQAAYIVILGCVIQAWSNYDKRQARKSKESAQ